MVKNSCWSMAVRFKIYDKAVSHMPKWKGNLIYTALVFVNLG